MHGVLLFLLQLSIAWPAPSPVDPGSVDDFIETLARQHPDGLSEADLRAAAVQGVLDWLYRNEGPEYPNLLTDQEYRGLLAAAEGRRHGLGLGVLAVPGYGLVVKEVFAGSPAAMAGVRTDDVVVAIDGKPLATAGPLTMLSFLSGRSATDTLALDLLGADGSPRRLRIAQGTYVVPPFTVQQDPRYAVVRINYFGQGLARSLATWLESVDDGQAVVLDVRDSEVGTLEEVTATAALFIGGGRTIGYVRSNSEEAEPLTTHGGSAWEHKLAILVNAGTRGVGELFAGSVRRNARSAVLVGTETGGAASLPAFLRIDANHVVRTAGKRLTFEDGASWEGHGLRVDVAVQPFAGLTLLPPPAPPPDLQVDTAVRLVSSP